MTRFVEETRRTTEDLDAMTSAVAEFKVPIEESEAFQVLMTRAGRKTGKIPAELVVRQVLACVPPPEWPTRIEATDALLRRIESAQREKMRVEARPAGGRLFGLYVTRRQGSGARPYRTVLLGIDPLRGRCDCPDFLKNSLGVCKHILIVVEHLYARPRVLQQALNEQEWGEAQPANGFSWDPIRPLTGAGDWLERIVWRGDRESAGARSTHALKWFRSSRDGCSVLKNALPVKPARRLELVEDLLKAIPSSGSKSLQDPALRTLLEKEIKRLRPLVEHTLGGGEIRDGYKGLKRELYAYQREGVERFLAAGRLLLADDMGLGKTAQAIACCNILRTSGRIRRGLIIAPASLKPQWAREWAVFSDLPVQVVDGDPDERQAIYTRQREGFLIINYEQLLRDLEVVREWNPELVVLDEAQRIKNWATKTALTVKGLAPPYRLVLTGTPMENRIDELASIVEWVDDMALEPKWRLSSLHSIRTDGRREVVGARNLDTIRDRLRHCMVRRLRQEVLDQLPARTDTRVPVEMTQEQRDEHDALIQPILVLIQKASVRPLTQVEFLRLMSLLTTQRIVSNGLAQLQFEDTWPTIHGRRPDDRVLQGLFAPKLNELRQLIRQIVLEQGRKVVVFSQWRRMLALAQWAVSDLLGENGLRSGFFTGAEGQRRRTQNIVEFHDDPDFRLLFTSDAGGVGLNLQRAANCVINLELPWNPAVLEQRIGRIYRLGQKSPIDVYNLVCEYGVESRIATLVGSKQAFFKGLFDGESDSVHFEEASNFIAKVQKLYEPTAVDAVAATGNVADVDADSADSSLDDEIVDPFDELIEAADESRDLAVTQSADGESIAAVSAAPIPFAPTIVSSRDENGIPSAVAALPSADGVREFFSQLQVRREAGGHVVIEAPAEAASTLGALFEGMAALLQAAARPKG
jgi:superfamily II DNA or RNA helicase